MRKTIGFIALGAFLLFTLFGEAVYLYTDFLWFREIGYSGVFTKTLWIKVLLGVISGVLFFVLFYVNIKLAARLREGVVPLQSKNPEVPGPEELDPLIKRLLLPVALGPGDSWPRPRQPCTGNPRCCSSTAFRSASRTR